MSVFQAAMPTGNYPNMGAGYLANSKYVIVETTSVGWWKIADLTIDQLMQIHNVNSTSYSGVILIQGVTRSGDGFDYANTGLIEIDAATTSGSFATTNMRNIIKIISGDIEPNNLAVVNNGDTLSIYANYPVYARYCWTVICEAYGQHTGKAIEITPTFYGTTAPSGAVYAVVRNRASADADGNELVNTSTEQTISGRKNFALSGANDPIRVISAWEKTGNSTTRNNYIEFLDSNNSRTGIIGQKTAGTDRYGVYLQCGNEGSLQVLSDGENVYFLLSKNPPATDNTTSIATTKWVNDKGYITAIPVASQTVLGGVKVYTDSDGYFCIDTQ